MLYNAHCQPFCCSVHMFATSGLRPSPIPPYQKAHRRVVLGGLDTQRSTYRSSGVGTPPRCSCQARAPHSMGGPTAAAAAVAAAAMHAGPALAGVHAEPANALSLPTWAIHISSTVEWGTAMLLFWKYADVTGNQRWKGLTWGMLPLLGGAMSACTYHFFYNPPELDILVALQAFLTWLGNATCAWAAYRIYADAKTSSS